MATGTEGLSWRVSEMSVGAAARGAEDPRTRALLPDGLTGDGMEEEGEGEEEVGMVTETSMLNWSEEGPRVYPLYQSGSNMRQDAEQGTLPTILLRGFEKKLQSRLARVRYASLFDPRVWSHIWEELHSQTKPSLSGTWDGPMK